MADVRAVLGVERLLAGYAGAPVCGEATVGLRPGETVPASCAPGSVTNMLYFSNLESALIAVWILGILVAVALIFLKSPDLRTRIILLVFSVAIPVVGSVPVILYGAYKFTRTQQNHQQG